MLKIIAQKFTARREHEMRQKRRDEIEAWSLQVGREAAELWVQALSARDTARLSNA